MDKYIDIELLKAQFDKHCEQVGESVDDWGMFYEEFPRMLADIPFADVQPVVHCKDCKYLIPSKDGKDDICKKLSSEKYLFCIQGKDFYCKCGLKKHNGK